MFGDDCTGEGVDRASRAQIVDPDVDRLGQLLGFCLEHQLDHRRDLKEGADDAAVKGGQDRVADQPVTEAQDGRQLVAFQVCLDPQEPAVRYCLNKLREVGFASLCNGTLEDVHQGMPKSGVGLPGTDLVPSIKAAAQVAMGSSRSL